MIKERMKTIFRVALPMMVQGLVFQLQSLTDKAFLGNLDTRFVSAAGAAQMPYVATLDSMVAVSTGLIIMISHLFGAGKKDRIADYVKSMAFYNTLAGIFIFAAWYLGAEKVLLFFQVDESILPYSLSYIKICMFFFLFAGIDSALQAMLQGIGRTAPIMYAGVLKVGLNILISWVLIFGKLGFPALYVTGAAIGTLSANIASFVFILIYCMVCTGGEKEGGIDLRMGHIRLKKYGECIRLGVPVGLEYLLWNGSNLLLIRFINGFSYLDMAIYTLTFGFQSIVYVIFEGTSKATLSLMGQKIGAGNRREANAFFYTTIKINFVIVMMAILLFSCMPKTLLGIFSKDMELIERGVGFLIGIGIIMLPQSINIICGNAIRANGNTKWMLWSQVLGSVLVISISCFLIEVMHMDMAAIYITLFLDEGIRGMVNLFYYRKKYARF